MPKQQTINLKAKGLWTQHSRLDAAEGSLLQADNVVIDRVSAIEPRRGFSRYNSVAFSNLPTNPFEYKNKLIVLDGTTFKYDNGSGTFSSWSGTFTKATDAVCISTAQQQNNLYFTSNVGIYKNDAINAIPILAGITEGLDAEFTLFNVGTGWLPNNYITMYKFVWIKKDANKNEILGAPSVRLRVENTGLAADVRVTTTIPSDINTNDYVEIYRAELPAAASVDPGDDCLLLQRVQVNVTSKSTTLTRAAGTVTATASAHGYTTGDYIRIVGADQTEYNGIWRITVTGTNTFTYTISTTPVTPATGTITSTVKTFTFEDVYNDAFLDGNIQLYTNTNEEGLTNGNYKPPLSCTIAEWQNVMWYANTQREQRKTLYFKDTSSITTGVDTLTITGSNVHTYTFAVAEDINNKQFQLYTAGTASANLNNTVASLVRVINRDITNTEIYAWQDTSAEARPGTIHIFSRSTANTILYFTSSVGSKWEDILPSTGTSVYSDNENKQNRLYFSKYLRPEAVPLLNFWDIGGEEHAIEAIVALKDNLIVLKTDGVWRMNGTATAFAKDELDLTTFITAPNSARRLGDRVYAMTNKGVVKINEYGIEIVSFPIDEDIIKVSSYTNFRSITSATSYEGLGDNKYILFVQTDSADTRATQAYVYNYLLNVWTKWVKAVSAGHSLLTDKKLYLCHNVDKYVLQERRTFATDNSDYCDEEIDITVTAVDNTGSTTKVTVTYTYSTVSLSAGFLFKYTVGLIESKVTAVTSISGTSYQLTLAESLTLPAAPFSASVLLPIFAVVKWVSETGNNVALAKRFQQALIYMANDNAQYNYISCGTNREITEESIYCPVANLASLGWGVSPWGVSPWGSPTSSTATPLKVDIPQQHRIAEELFIKYTHSMAKEHFKILAVSIFLGSVADRFSRIR